MSPERKWERMSERLAALWARDGGRCHYCGVAVVWYDELPWGTLAWSNDPRLATTDHRTPLRRGGADAMGNLVLCCRGCNSRKGTKSYLDFRFMTWLEQEAG